MPTVAPATTKGSICHVWDCEYPWDVRVEKLSRTLQLDGWEVNIVARNRRRDPSTEKLAEGVVHRLRPWSAIPVQIDAQLQFPAFFSPRWYRRIRQTIANTCSRVVLARDLPLCPTAILAARREGVPVVFDMAENYPAMIRAIWDTGAKGPFDFVVRNPSLVTRVEQWVLPRVDHVIAVCEESAERIRRAGVAPEKITIVSNTPEIRVGASTASPTEGEVLRVSYLGLVEAMRGIEVIAEAVGILARQGMRIELTVVGDGPHMPNLRAFIKARELSNVVQLHGRLPHEEALKVAQSAHIGVVPHLKSEMTDTTVPNKLFDYMAAGMPVVVSSARPLARIVSETGCGFVFTSGDAQSCADALAALSVHAAWTKCSAAGIEAISKHYNWSLDADRLKRLFATIA